MKSMVSFAEFYKLHRPILCGWSYLYNLAGMQGGFDFMQRTDEDTLYADWANIGDDMRHVMSGIDNQEDINYNYKRYI